MGRYSCEILTDPLVLAELEQEWWQLWQRAEQASPFQSPAWLLPWIFEFSAERLCCAAVRKDGRLVGLLPTVLDEHDGERGLALCGSGISDYLDGVFDDANLSSIVCIALDAIIAHEGNVLTATFSNLQPGAVLALADVPTNWHELAQSVQTVCPVLALEPAKDLAGLIPHKMNKALEYARRRASRSFDVRFERADASDALAQFEVIASLHRQRWSTRNESGLLDEPAVRRFHLAAVPKLIRHNLVRLDVLCLDGQPAAALYSLVGKRRWHYYLGGFNPDFAKFSVGTLIVGEALDWAMQECCVAFDFMRGAEPYKYRWGAKDEVSVTRRLSLRPRN